MDLIEMDFTFITDETFDFGVNSPSDSLEESAEVDDEVIPSPTLLPERCVAQTIDLNIQVRDKTQDCRESILHWSPLSPEKLEEIAKEANLLAAQLENCSMQAKENCNLLLRNASGLNEPSIPEKNSAANIRLLYEKRSPKNPRSPRRETFFVRDSPLKDMLPTVDFVIELPLNTPPSISGMRSPLYPCVGELGLGTLGRPPPSGGRSRKKTTPGQTPTSSPAKNTPSSHKLSCRDSPLQKIYAGNRSRPDGPRHSPTHLNFKLKGCHSQGKCEVQKEGKSPMNPIINLELSPAYDKAQVQKSVDFPVHSSPKLDSSFRQEKVTKIRNGKHSPNVSSIDLDLSPTRQKAVAKKSRHSLLLPSPTGKFSTPQDKIDAHKNVLSPSHSVPKVESPPTREIASSHHKKHVLNQPRVKMGNSLNKEIETLKTILCPDQPVLQVGSSPTQEAAESPRIKHSSFTASPKLKSSPINVKDENPKAGQTGIILTPKVEYSKARDKVETHKKICSPIYPSFKLDFLLTQEKVDAHAIGHNISLRPERPALSAQEKVEDFQVIKSPIHPSLNMKSYQTQEKAGVHEVRLKTIHSCPNSDSLTAQDMVEAHETRHSPSNRHPDIDLHIVQGPEEEFSPPPKTLQTKELTNSSMNRSFEFLPTEKVVSPLVNLSSSFEASATQVMVESNKASISLNHPNTEVDYLPIKEKIEGSELGLSSISPRTKAESLSEAHAIVCHFKPSSELDSLLEQEEIEACLTMQSSINLSLKMDDLKTNQKRETRETMLSPILSQYKEDSLEEKEVISKEVISNEPMHFLINQNPEVTFSSMVNTELDSHSTQELAETDELIHSPLLHTSDVNSLPKKMFEALETWCLPVNNCTTIEPSQAQEKVEALKPMHSPNRPNPEVDNLSTNEMVDDSEIAHSCICICPNPKAEYLPPQGNGISHKTCHFHFYPSLEVESSPTTEKLEVNEMSYSPILSHHKVESSPTQEKIETPEHSHSSGNLIPEVESLPADKIRHSPIHYSLIEESSTEEKVVTLTTQNSSIHPNVKEETSQARDLVEVHTKKLFSIYQSSQYEFSPSLEVEAGKNIHSVTNQSPEMEIAATPEKTNADKTQRSPFHTSFTQESSPAQGKAGAANCMHSHIYQSLKMESSPAHKKAAAQKNSHLMTKQTLKLDSSPAEKKVDAQSVPHSPIHQSVKVESSYLWDETQVFKNRSSPIHRSLKPECSLAREKAEAQKKKHYPTNTCPKLAPSDETIEAQKNRYSPINRKLQLVSSPTIEKTEAKKNKYSSIHQSLKLVSSPACENAKSKTKMCSPVNQSLKPDCSPSGEKAEGQKKRHSPNHNIPKLNRSPREEKVEDCKKRHSPSHLISKQESSLTEKKFQAVKTRHSPVHSSKQESLLLWKKTETRNSSTHAVRKLECIKLQELVEAQKPKLSPSSKDKFELSHGRNAETHKMILPGTIPSRGKSVISTVNSKTSVSASATEKRLRHTGIPVLTSKLPVSSIPKPVALKIRSTTPGLIGSAKLVTAASGVIRPTSAPAIKEEQKGASLRLSRIPTVTAASRLQPPKKVILPGTHR